MMNAAPSTKVASRPSTASVGEMMRPSVMDVTASADQNGNGERMLYVPMTWSAACAIVASGWSPQRSASRSDDDVSGNDRHRKRHESEQKRSGDLMGDEPICDGDGDRENARRNEQSNPDLHPCSCVAAA